MVVLLYLLNLVVSLVLAVPMYRSLSTSLGTSQAGERMARDFDYLWWEEYRADADGLETSFTPALLGKGAVLTNLEGMVLMTFLNLPGEVLILGFFYLLLQTFLAGGVVSVLGREDPRTGFGMSAFVLGAARRFPTFLGIMLTASAAYFVIAGGMNRLSTSLVARSARTAASEVTPFALSLIFSILILILLLFFQMMFDYARIISVDRSQRNVLKAITTGLGFIFRNLGAALGLFALLLLAHVLVTLLYLLVESLIPQGALPGMAAAALLHQSLIFAVVWIRCWTYASQIELVRYSA